MANLIDTCYANHTLAKREKLLSGVAFVTTFVVEKLAFSFW